MREGQGIDKMLSEFDKLLRAIAEKIIRLEKNRNDLSKVLLGARDQLDLTIIPNKTLYQDIIEPEFIYKVTPSNLHGMQIIGIDGSIISKSLHGVDLILTRAVAVLFKFLKDKPAVQYFPNVAPNPRLVVNFDIFSSSEIDILNSLARLEDEIQLAIEMTARNPDIILLDGSIIPLILDKPPSSSALNRKYIDIIEKYEDLFQKCLERDILLAGVIKDTRSTRFMHILGRVLPILISKIPALREVRELDYRPIIQQTRDSTFLFRFLQPGERSFTFRYSESASKHAILKDFTKRDWSEMIYSFYLKPVQFDLPTKVEFLAPTNPIKYAKRIASVILPISNQHAEFGVPSVLIEADARARLFENDLDYVHDSLSHAVSTSGFSTILLKLRRDKRPFRQKR
ncbi:MAG: DNA double-strand break repair nuclease NurA [Candidatus Helarchaeota archaeon]|nr:DNA double-strand break repair nuclease NurA [Candidatus Helarchaeota archaeon]